MAAMKKKTGRVLLFMAVFMFCHSQLFAHNMRGPVWGIPTNRKIVKKAANNKSAKRSYSAMYWTMRWMIAAFQQSISPQDGPTCPHKPVCSVYGKRSLQRFGPLRGSVMAADRILRCHPWQKKEDLVDPVPAHE